MLESMQQFFVPGPLPGLNEILDAAKSGRGKTNAYARLKNYWETIIVLHIRKARIQPVKEAYFRFMWYEKNRRRDPDNIVVARKFIMDSLVDDKILENDGWGQVRGFTDRWFVHAGEPGVTVQIIQPY